MGRMDKTQKRKSLINKDIEKGLTKGSQTMGDMYGDGSNHESCSECGFCKTCGDRELLTSVLSDLAAEIEGNPVYPAEDQSDIAKALRHLDDKYPRIKRMLQNLAS